MGNFLKSGLDVFTLGLTNEKYRDKYKKGIMGERETDPRLTEANKQQEEAFNRLKGIYSEDPTAAVNASAAREQNMAAGGIQDSKRRIRELIAQRGMGRSSIGQAQEGAAERLGQERIQNIKLSIPERIRQLKEGNARKLFNASRGVQYHEDNKVVGGILPMVGAGVGAYYGKGDPGAMKMGAGMGQGIQGLYHQQRR